MEWIILIVTVIVGGIGIAVGRKLMKKETVRECGRDYPKDTVILHQFPRGPFAPSMSGFCIKLETFLRMHKIPYQNVFSYTMGPKGKSPWIEYNGTMMGDSHLIMDFLTDQLQLKPAEGLSAEQKAVGGAFEKMVENHTYWLVLLERWVYHKRQTMQTLTKLSALLVWYIERRTKKMAHAHGIGRHAPEEVSKLLCDDLSALSDFIGEKKFLLGDEPSVFDCAVFGQLCQVKWHVPQSVPAWTLMEEKLVNLNDYLDRMREAFWPDWDDCTSKGFTKEATK